MVASASYHGELMAVTFAVVLQQLPAKVCTIVLPGIDQSSPMFGLISRPAVYLPTDKCAASLLCY